MLQLDRRRRPTRRLALGVAALAACSACVTPPDSGVAVKSISTDLVFGVPPKVEPVAPPNLNLTPEDPLGVVALPGFRTNVTPAPVASPAPPPPDCPTAPPTSFPREPSTTVVKGKPQEGVYRWVVDGRQNVQAIGTIPLPRSTKRSVLNVTDGSSGTFRYTLEEREMAFGSSTTVRSTYEVQPTEQSGRDPGIYLVEVLRLVGNEPPRSFRPSPPVLFLPLPVKIGAPPLGPAGTAEQDQIDSVGVDPRTLEVLHHVGNVTRRMEVDACGEKIQAWFVDASQEFAGGDETFQRNYDYGIATQSGGILVFEHVETPCASTDDNGACQPPPDLVFDARLGQLEPDPLPTKAS